MVLLENVFSFLSFYYFPDYFLATFHRCLSVLIRCQTNSPLKFENIRIRTKSFVDRVRLWWGPIASRTCSLILDSKLKALKLDFKKWSEVFGHGGKRK